MITLSRNDCRPIALRQASDFLQALAHPVRLQILEAIRREPASVGQVVERLGLAQPVVSRHLAILRKAGVVSVRAAGRERIYRVGNELAHNLLETLFVSPEKASAA